MSLRMLRLKNETNASCPDLKGQGYKASFHTHSFAKGPRKKIYHGHLDGKGPRKGEHAVVKVFRDVAGTEEMCDAEINKHKLGRRLAKKFNKLVPNQQCKINFTLPLKSTIERLGFGCYLTRHKTRHMDKKEWVLIEENLVRESEYQVFIRKTGERMISDPTTLDAFLHFSYHESGGKFVLCGFQGVQTDSGYLLTTPCIHSTDTIFGPSTDKGPKGMRKVFDFHRCNNLCYSFILPDKSLDDSTENDSNESDNNDKNNKLDIGMKVNNIPPVLGENRICVSEEEDETVDSLRSKVKRGGSERNKEWQGGKGHRSNVQAVLGIRKRPSF